MNSPHTFADLRLAPPVLRAVSDEGYTTPTPIQAKAIPSVLEGRDLLGCAQTGTGKTAAFALPILHRLMTEPANHAHRGPAIPRALILAPTRELAGQITDSFATYGRHTSLSHTSVFGGVSQFHQVRALKNGIDILVATPGRLIDLMEQRLVNLTSVSIFVLDEADRMLDMGFIQPIRRIASALTTPHRQTLLFSATMPREIVHLAESLLKNPVKVAVNPVASLAPKVEQSVYMVPRMRKQALLEHLLDQDGVDRAIVFTKTKHGADKVARRLHQAGISSAAIHGNKAQNQRLRALDAFRRGRSRVLVATDVAARGLDVDGITHVFNFDLPMDPEGYVHRIGRTGRAGATGIAISFCDHEERGQLRDIERLTGAKFSPITNLPELPEPAPREHGAHDQHPSREPHHGGRTHAGEGRGERGHTASAIEHKRSSPGHSRGTHRTAAHDSDAQPRTTHRGGAHPPAQRSHPAARSTPHGTDAHKPSAHKSSSHASSAHKPSGHKQTSGGHKASAHPAGGHASKPTHRGHKSTRTVEDHRGRSPIQATNRPEDQPRTRPSVRSGRHPVKRKFKA